MNEVLQLFLQFTDLLMRKVFRKFIIYHMIIIDREHELVVQQKYLDGDPCIEIVLIQDDCPLD